jgi:predicted dehydrogenase
MAALRFGVVGTAYWAREIHIPGVIATENADLIGLWGRTPSTVEAIATRHGVTAFATFDEMLAQVDAVTIAVPPEAQVDFALRAIEAGRHVILEKPIARDTVSARAIAVAAERAGIANLVFFIRRFQPQVAAALAAAVGHGWTRADIRVHSDSQVTASPYAASVWRKDPGAALWDIGPHALSILIPLLGAVTAVEAEPELNGTNRLRTHHAGGGVAEISVSLKSSSDQTSNWYRLQSATRDIVLPDPVFSRTEVFGLAVQRLVAMVAAGQRHDPCGISLGATIVDILAQADASAREGGARRGVAPMGPSS